MFTAGKSPCSLAQGCAISRKGTGAKKSIVKLAVKLELCWACINCIKLTVKWFAKAFRHFFLLLSFILLFCQGHVATSEAELTVGSPAKNSANQLILCLCFQHLSAFHCPALLKSKIEQRHHFVRASTHHLEFEPQESTIACDSLFVPRSKSLAWNNSICWMAHLFPKGACFLHLVFCSFPLVFVPGPIRFLLLCQWVLAADLLWVAVAYRDRRQVQEEEMRQRHEDLCALAAFQLLLRLPTFLASIRSASRLRCLTTDFMQPQSWRGMLVS